VSVHRCSATRKPKTQEKIAKYRSPNCISRSMSIPPSLYSVSLADWSRLYHYQQQPRLTDLPGRPISNPIPKLRLSTLLYFVLYALYSMLSILSSLTTYLVPTYSNVPSYLPASHRNHLHPPIFSSPLPSPSHSTKPAIQAQTQRVAQVDFIEVVELG